MSQKAFITQFNAHRIVKQCHLVQLEDIDEQIWNEELNVFNRLEINELKAFIALLKDSAHFFEEVWIPFEKVKDNFVWMTPPKLPAYHLDKDCSAMRSDYHNFKVPKSIREKGAKKVQEFRDWFKKLDGERLLEQKSKTFESFLAQAYGPGVAAEFLQEYGNSQDAANSGQARFISMSLEELKQWIEEHLDSADEYWFSTSMVSEILRTMIKRSYSGVKTKYFRNATTYPDDEVIETLKTVHDKYKIPLMNALLAFYTKSYNPDLSIEIQVLEQLKFRPCGMCSSNSELRSTPLAATDTPIPF